MIIKIKTHPKSKQDLVKVEKTLFEDIYKVYTTEAPENNKANKAVINLLSKFFDTAKSNIAIKKGHTKSNKIIEIKA